MNQKLPPANIEAEEAVLGCILFDPRLINQISETLPVEAFFVGNHQTIYRSMIYVQRQGFASDYMAVSQYLAGQNQLDTVGGTTKLAQLLNRTVSSLNCDRYAKLVLDNWRRRQLIAIGHQIVEAGYDRMSELSEHYLKIKELLPEEITGAAPTEKSISFKSARYSVYSEDRSKKLELEADLATSASYSHAIGELATKTEAAAESLWGEAD